MNVRLALGVTGLCVALTASQALAAPHKAKGKGKGAGPVVCNQINDPTPDAIVDLTNGLAKKGQQDDTSDIISADLASNAKDLTAVIRLKSLAGSPTVWPEAHFYLLQWTVPDHATPVYLGGTIDPNPASAAFGTQFYFGDVANFPSSATTVFIGFNVDQAAKVKGTVSTDKATVTLSVPISQLSGYGTFSPGTRFSDITAESQVLINGPDTPANLPLFGGTLAQGVSTPDTDLAAKPYVAGTPSCVKPGA
ncbi:MAG: hypothetical protein M3N21_08925 [Actinomycetota bacterium]|nr:hypothetical protein [Actinomycetota bacterium]